MERATHRRARAAAVDGGSRNKARGLGSSPRRTRSRALNPPGHWDVFIGHTRRNLEAVLLASELYTSLVQLGLTVWLDVKMGDMDELAMQEGVEHSDAMIAVVTGPCINNDSPRDEDPMENAYFKRDYCVQELRWAQAAGVFIQPVIRNADKGNVQALLQLAPADLRDLSKTEWIHMDRSNLENWHAGIAQGSQSNPGFDHRRSRRRLHAIAKLLTD